MATDEQKTTYVLVVDDNAASLMVYERFINRIPRCFPKCFTDPAEALAWSREHLPAIVIVDYRMPTMNGLDFIRDFRTISNRNAVPCIVLTGVRDERIRREALQLGVVDFLTKPASGERLVAHILRALARS